MSVLTAVSANTFRGTVFGVKISRLKGMPNKNSIHNQAKAKYSVLLLELFADISVKGQYYNAFLVFLHHTRKRLQKYIEFYK